MNASKPIIDVCCGSRMFWFDKKNKNVVFCDNRKYKDTLCDGRILEINPDIKCDFTALPFPEKSFKLVVYDPPHLLHIGTNSWMAKKYGKLPDDWPRILKCGFDECMRILDDYGVLIFKWNETQITVKQIINVIGVVPLFGNKSGKYGKTHWLCFMKGIS